MKDALTFILLMGMSMISVTVLIIMYIIHKIVNGVNKALGWVIKKIGG